MSQLGTILRNRREELNLTQADVSRQTNIRVNIIDALEKGKNSILPPTYLRSFSKSYWQFLKLPMEDFEKSFAESGIMPQVQEQSFIGTLIHPEKEKEFTPPAPLKAMESPKYSPRLVSGFISAAMILILIVGVYFLFIKDIVNDTPVEPGAQIEANGNTGNSQSESGGELLSIFEDEPTKDSIILEVTAKNNTWFTINADGKKSQEVLLASGQSGRWSAVEYFILSISNNGGAIFKRNGQTLENIGKAGTIIRELKITANDMKTSAMPYEDGAENEKNKKQDQQAKTESVKEKAKKQTETSQKSASKPINKTTTPKKTTDVKAKNKTTQVDAKPKQKTVESTSLTKKKSETTNKKKTSSEKSTSSIKKKPSEKSKTADKKKKTTAASKSKDAKKTTKKTTSEKKKSTQSSNKVETPKSIPISNPRR